MFGLATFLFCCFRRQEVSYVDTRPEKDLLMEFGALKPRTHNLNEQRQVNDHV